MKRRAFLKRTLVTGPLAALVARMAPTRYVEAVRSRRYPGRVALADAREMARPGKWAG